MDDHRRTRSQGLPEGEQLVRWDSLQDPVRIEREQAETRRQAREASTVINKDRTTMENSEIPQLTDGQPRLTEEMPRTGEILPNQRGPEGQTMVTPKSGEILPKRREKDNPHGGIEGRGKIPPKEPDEVTDLKAMEEGVSARTPDTRRYSEEDSRKDSPQIDTVQHFLDDNFSDVMRSSVLGSNVSSLFNTTTFDTTHSDQKITLDWILPDGKNSQLETVRDKHIADFPAPGGSTGAMLVHLPDLEPFYNTSEFLIDLQSGELFVKLKG